MHGPIRAWDHLSARMPLMSFDTILPKQKPARDEDEGRGSLVVLAALAPRSNRISAAFKCTDRRTRNACRGAPKDRKPGSLLDAHEANRLGRNCPDEGIESFEPNWPLHGSFGSRFAGWSACRV